MASSARALPLPLWERDMEGNPDFTRPVSRTRRDPLEAQIIRLSDRLDHPRLRTVADDSKTVSPEIMAAITLAANLAAANVQKQIPDMEEIARSVVVETWQLMDVDTTKHEEIVKFRKAFAHMRVRMETQEKITGHAWLVLTGLLVAGMCYLLLARFTPPQYPMPNPPAINPATGRP